MGTNFYIVGHTDDEGPDHHIGKRSAAGPYCWDCSISLIDGKLHSSESKARQDCPRCGKERNTEGLEESSAGRELGFNKSTPQKKTGVASCSSFGWCMSPVAFEEAVKNKKGKTVEDEYGRKFTTKQFRDILKECPINLYGSIGEWFC